MAKEVGKREANNYLVQAEEFLVSARENIESDRYNVAGFNAIQAIINANDALTVYFLGRRASKDHREALKFHADVVKIINDSSQRGRLKEAISQRASVGYTAITISKRDSEKLVKNAVRFVDWVKQYVKK